MLAENFESTNCRAGLGRVTLPLLNYGIKIMFTRTFHDPVNLPLDGEGGEADPVLVVVLCGGDHHRGGEQEDHLLRVTRHIN